MIRFLGTVVRFLQNYPHCQQYLPPLDDSKKWEWLTQHMGALDALALSKMERIIASISLCPAANKSLRSIGLSVVVKIVILLQESPEVENKIPPPGSEDWARILLDIEKHPWE